MWGFPGSAEDVFAEKRVLQGSQTHTQRVLEHEGRINCASRMFPAATIFF